jgi:hypothetical protein
MGKLKYSEIDFNTLKTSLKDFLRSQSTFEDYDFEGSGLNVLIDELCYNSALNAFYANMVANEMFIDSAIKRASVVSRAKQIGYTPRSVQSAHAYLKLQFFPLDFPVSISIPKGHKFTTTIDNVNYVFQVARNYTCFPNSLNQYIIENVEIYEGTPLTFRYTVDTNAAVRQRYIIPNASIDTSKISVRVQKSVTNTAFDIYELHQDLNELDGEDKVYFLQEVDGEKFELIFGDGIVGKALENGNIIIIDYVVSAGPAANKGKLFSQPVKLGGYEGTIITTQVVAFGGLEIESIESIRKLAPLSYEAQNRAVTKSDYETLIRKDYPKIEYVRVWGGEENDPPQYGRIFASVKPTQGTSLSLSEKQFIVNEIIRKRSIISMETLLVEPDYIRIVPNVTAYYRGKLTTKSAGQIRDDVVDSITNFRDNELNGFDAKFRLSRLNAAIDASDVSVSSNQVGIKLKYRIVPPLNIPTLFNINFNTQLDRGDATNNVSTLSSTAFTYRGLPSYLGDDGKGGIYIYRIFDNRKVIFERGVGTIDYVTGQIQIPQLKVEAIPSGDVVDIFVVPAVSDVTPIRNQILLMEDEDISVTVVNEDL